MSFGFAHLPNLYEGSDVQMFTLPTSNSGLGWHVWNKPRGKTMLDLLLVGGAGGGGGGFSGIAGSGRGGGGGGACSGFAHVVIPLIYLPDVLYVQIGAGSQGVTVGQAADGVISFVCCQPGTATLNGDTVAASQGTAPKGGNTGTAIAAGNGGTPGTASTLSIMPIAGSGQVTFIVGVAGSIGGVPAGAAGPNNPQNLTGIMTWPGGGGGGTTSADFAGSDQRAGTVGLLQEAVGGAAPAGSNDGASGRLLLPPRYPLYSTSGCGGASSNAGVGGIGGDGGPGSGGGGGGGGTTGGRGGKGGDGFAIFTCW